MSENQGDQKPKSFLESIAEDRNRPKEDAETPPETKAKTPHTLGSEDARRSYRQGVEEEALRQSLRSGRRKSTAKGEAFEPKKPEPGKRIYGKGDLAENLLG